MGEEWDEGLPKKNYDHDDHMPKRRLMMLIHILMSTMMMMLMTTLMMLITMSMSASFAKNSSGFLQPLIFKFKGT